MPTNAFTSMGAKDRNIPAFQKGLVTSSVQLFNAALLPSSLNHLMKLKKDTIILKALDVLFSYINNINNISNSHIYLPGIGTVNGFAVGNYIDNAGTIPSILDQPVGLVYSTTSAITASQVVIANQPILKLTNNRYNWVFDATDTLAAIYPAGYESVTIIDAQSAGQVTTTNVNIVGTYNMGPNITLYGRIIVKGTLLPTNLVLLQNFANKLAGL